MGKTKKFFMYLVLTVASILSVFPLYYMFCASTNRSIDVIAGKLIPGTYLMENFKVTDCAAEPAPCTVELVPECNGTDGPLSSGLLNRRLWI